MHIIFFNPQGNFDAVDSHLTEHPDFGGQLVYVKEVAMAMVDAGHQVDIVTRRGLSRARVCRAGDGRRALAPLVFTPRRTDQQGQSLACRAPEADSIFAGPTLGAPIVELHALQSAPDVSLDGSDRVFAVAPHRAFDPV